MNPPQVILVTGATSGIGEACAALLARQGHVVIGTGRRAGGDLDAACPPGTVTLARMDVDDTGSVERCVTALLERCGRVDAVVNNAGFGIGGAVEDTSPEEALAQLQTNVLGVLRVCRAVLPAMRRQGAGCIVNVSSLGGLMGLPFQGLYSASKFAVEGLSEALRLEVRPFGVRVVLVEPGDVATGFTAARRMARAADERSPYRRAFARAMERIAWDEGHGVPAAAVAATVAEAIAHPSPPMRLPVGKVDQRLAAVLKRHLPDWVMERILSGHYG